MILCHVVYEPGTTVARHSHETAERLTWIVEGGLTMTVGDETKRLSAEMSPSSIPASSMSCTQRAA